MKEIWKSINGYEESYEISNLGVVRSIDRFRKGKTKLGTYKLFKLKGRNIKPYIEKGKRSNIKPSVVYVLCKDSKTKHFYAHRLVAIHFIENKCPEIYTEVNHIDGNRLNNVVTNLEWVTRDQNIKHAFDNNLINTKKPVRQISVSGKIIAEHESVSQAARTLGLKQGHISRAIQRGGSCGGYLWEFITKNL